MQGAVRSSLLVFVLSVLTVTVWVLPGPAGALSGSSGSESSSRRKLTFRDENNM